MALNPGSLAQRAYSFVRGKQSDFRKAQEQRTPTGITPLQAPDSKLTSFARSRSNINAANQNKLKSFGTLPQSQSADRTTSLGQKAASFNKPTPVRQFSDVMGEQLQTGLSTPVTPTPSVLSTAGGTTSFTQPSTQGQANQQQQQGSRTLPTPQPEGPGPEGQNLSQRSQFSPVPSPMAALQNQINALQNQISSAYTPSAEEQALQQQITSLTGDANLAISGEEGLGRGRELSLVRGRQGQIQEQANLQLQTLTNQLANLQAQRTAEQQQAITRLGFLQDQATQLEPQVLSTGEIIQIDPVTGQVSTLRQAPTSAGEGFTLGEGQARYDASGNLIAAGPAGAAAGGYDPNELLSIEEATKLGVDFGTTVGQAIQMGITPGAAAASQDGEYFKGVTDRALNAVQTAMNLLPKTTGLGAIGRVAASKVPGTDSYNLRAALDTIAGNISFSELQAMRDASKTGGALGQVSERELALLSSVLGSLDLGQSNEQLASNLQEIQKYLSNINSSIQTGTGTTGLTAQQQQNLQNALQSGSITQQEYDDYIASFTNDLSTSGNGSDISNVVSNFNANVVGNIQPSTRITSVPLGNKSVSVNESIAQRLAAADAEYFAATGQHIPVNESFRSPERQAQLYRELSAKGAQVAPQGYSFHELGMAVDVGDAWQAVRPYLMKYGFRNDLPNDRGHFSVGEFA